MKHIAILGSTGSIGRSTLSVVESYPERFTLSPWLPARNLDGLRAGAALETQVLSARG